MGYFVYFVGMEQGRDVTIYDIAKALNISASTVSRGLKKHPTVNKATQERIAEKAKAMGFRINSIAANLRQRSTKTIGIIIHELNSQFTTNVLAGIEQVTTPAGYDLVIAHSSESYTKEIQNAGNLFDKRVDGLIATLAYDTTALAHYDPYIQKKVPLVFFDRVEESAPGVKIVIDNRQAGYNAAMHLIEQGCRRIAHCGASQKRNVFAGRYQGYRDALTAAGLEFDPELVFINDQTEGAIRTAVGAMLAMGARPDGVFLANDFNAAVCIRAIKEAGLRVPEDIAVVGFNNDVISKLIEPAITTVNYPGLEVGRAAAGEMLWLLDHPEDRMTDKKILIGSDLIIRGSSQRRPARH